MVSWKKTKLFSIDLFFGDKKTFYYRSNSVGDKGVIEQIFQNQDYNIREWAQGQRLMNYYNDASNDPFLIVDAGANIGASAVYFSNIFKNSVVFSIEPVISNFQILEINTKHHLNKVNYLGALSNADGVMSIEDPGISDWGFRTTPVDNLAPNLTNTVKCISPPTIFEDPRIAGAIPLIFKIDIEGAENELFSGDVSWMTKFPLIIIELHDWMFPFSGSSLNFLKATSSFEFDFLHKGENIFLFNRVILGK